MSTTEDSVIFHFPPDVLEAVVSALPLLVRARDGVVKFFLGCGVSKSYLDGVSAKLAQDQKYTKFHATRDVLVHLNGLGDAGLAARRQVIQRISQWSEFSSSWPNDQMAARGAVAQVAQLVNQKDAFTRMNIEREQAHSDNRRAREAEIAAVQAKRAELAVAKDDLFALFGVQDPQRRGKDLEGVLNRLFKLSGILVSEAFEIRNEEVDGRVIEQIDGAIVLDGRTYLVEVKWWKDPLSRGDVAPHLVSVYGRAGAGGILISASGFHDSAVIDFQTALSTRTVVMAELREIVDALATEHPIDELLRAKVRAAALERKPLVYPLGT